MSLEQPVRWVQGVLPGVCSGPQTSSATQTYFNSVQITACIYWTWLFVEFGETTVFSRVADKTEKLTVGNTFHTSYTSPATVIYIYTYTSYPVR